MYSTEDLFYTVLDLGDRAMSWYQSLRHTIQACFKEESATRENRELAATNSQSLNHSREL